MRIKTLIQLTAPQLSRIFRQCVITTLGEGQLGCLALILSDNAYIAIPNSIPFIIPVKSGPFVIATAPIIRSGLPLCKNLLHNKQLIHLKKNTCILSAQQ